ncbi:hypothetical protein F5X98DRAFT_337370, partial [Xylaria grammica]
MPVVVILGTIPHDVFFHPIYFFLFFPQGGGRGGGVRAGTALHFSTTPQLHYTTLLHYITHTPTHSLHYPSSRCSVGISYIVGIPLTHTYPPCPRCTRSCVVARRGNFVETLIQTGSGCADSDNFPKLACGKPFRLSGLNQLSTITQHNRALVQIDYLSTTVCLYFSLPPSGVAIPPVCDLFFFFFFFFFS